MIPYPHIDPVAIRLGPFPIHWYGLMYVVGFGFVWYLGRRKARTSSLGLTPKDVEDLVFFGALGAVIGGRLGYMLFYNIGTLFQDPLQFFKVWEGGMSFHGGLLGVFVAFWLFGRTRGKRVLDLTDFVAPFAPIGFFAGRIGNFINGELWGSPSSVPWAMVFPGGGPLARHPSQLYEALLEGVALFLILWVFTLKPRPRMSATGLGLLCYGIFRFFVEFFRMPDQQIGYLAFDWFTMGQLLSTPMILCGAGLLLFSYKKQDKPLP